MADALGPIPNIRNLARLCRSLLNPNFLTRLSAADVITLRSLLVGLAAERGAHSPPLADVMLTFLRGLPLWEVHGSAGAANQLVPLGGLLLAPAEVDDVAMLTSRFVRCGERERGLAKLMGCPEVRVCYIPLSISRAAAYSRGRSVSPFGGLI